MYKKILLLFLIFSLAIVSCKSNVSEETSGSCTISINSDDGVILEPTVVNFAVEETVLDVLKKVTRENKIQMEYSGLDTHAYVAGIDNLYEFDKGALSGWVYNVNDVYASKSCGLYKVNEGDIIQWKFTLEPIEQ